MHSARIALLLGLVLSFLHQNVAWGWGNVGHRAVGVIADKVLSEKTKQKVKLILGGSSLADVSIWADMIKRTDEWRHTSSYHYTGVPDGMDFVPHLKGLTQAELANGDVVLALLKAEDMLRDPQSSLTEQRAALSFLVHFLGDEHQPFHSGRSTDRGGNNISVNWMGKKTNLHAMWDANLIQSAFTNITSLPDQQQAEGLVQTIDKSTMAQRKAWMQGYFDTWTRESVDARVPAYTGFDGSQSLYLQKYIDVVKTRLLQAGYRLGGLLNSIYDPSSENTISDLAARSNSLRNGAQSILGANYLNDIVLKPITSVPGHQAKLLQNLVPVMDCDSDEE